MKNLIQFLNHLITSVALLTFSAAQAESVNFTVGSISRNMIIHAPSGIESGRPLVISLHGLNQNAAYQQSQAALDAVANTERFLVAYPNGLNSSWSLSGNTDIDFILTIIDYMADRYDIDRNRVYLSGFSMGGMMTYYAATRIADKIAAFAPISGYPIGGPNTASSRPIPIIHVHGTADDVVRYGNVQAHVNAWVQRNGCPLIPVVTAPYPSGKANSIGSKYYYGPGANGVEVVLMSLEGKGHWISNDVANGIHTSQEIWNFCKNYTVSGPAIGSGGVIFQEHKAGFVGVDGFVENSHSGFTGAGFANSADAAGAGIHWKMRFPTVATRSFTFRYASSDARAAQLVVNGARAADVAFAATGSWSAWNTLTVAVPVGAGIADVRLSAVSPTGLPNIDYLEVTGGEVVARLPLADGYVREGAGNSVSNFGTSTQLVVKSDGNVGSSFNRRGYLKFNAGDLGTATRVRLRLVPFQVDGAANLAYEALSDDTWTEAGLTWNNQPGAPGAIITSLGGYAVDTAATVDVTGIAKTQGAGDGILSLRISDPSDSNVFVGFHSKESAALEKRPQLEIVYPSAVPVAAIGAHLRFDETSGTSASDSSGNGWNGTLFGASSWVNGSNAARNGAVRLAGGYASLPAGVVSSLDDCSVEFWLKPDTVATWARVFDFNDGSTGSSMYFVPQTSGGLIRFGLGGQTLHAPAEVQIPASVWTHVAITLSGEIATIYLNGLEVAAGAMSNKPSSLGATPNNYIGRSASTADPNLVGIIDEFRIYRGALTAEEIAVLAIKVPVITSSPEAGGSVGSPFVYQIDSGGTAASYSANGLPAGLSLNVSSGLVSGVPAASGVFSVDLAATNAAGNGTLALVLTVAPSPILAEERTAPSLAITDGTALLVANASVVGHFYQLQYSDNLASEEWLNYGDAIPGTSGPLEFVMPFDPATPHRFYRLFIFSP